MEGVLSWYFPRETEETTRNYSVVGVTSRDSKRGHQPNTSQELHSLIQLAWVVHYRSGCIRYTGLKKPNGRSSLFLFDIATNHAYRYKCLPLIAICTT
jgi:hypothetical protein